MLTQQQRDRLEDAAASAVIAEAITGCPDSLSLAQWALESGWGQYSPGNNPFGIKAYEGCHGVQKLETHEYEHGEYVPETSEFATFPSLEAAFRIHGNLIARGQRYKAAFEQYTKDRDIVKLIRGIAPVYAPGNAAYSFRLVTILSMPDVRAALTAARLEHQTMAEARRDRETSSGTRPS